MTPALIVVRGRASAEELAAVTGVLLAAGSRDLAAPDDDGYARWRRTRLRAVRDTDGRG